MADLVSISVMSLYRTTVASLLTTAALTSAIPASAQRTEAILMRVPIRTDATGSAGAPNGMGAWRSGDWTWSSAEYCSTEAPQQRTVECVRDGMIAPDSTCSATPKPDTTRSIPRTSGCRFLWKAGKWSDPLPACGQTTQSRTMECTRSDGTKADERLCTTARGETVQPSVDFSTCSYAWSTGEWDEWSSRCSANATRKRQVLCIRADGAPFEDGRCASVRPEEQETASLFDSCGYQWEMGPWKAAEGATQCGSRTENRVVRCVSESGSGAEDPKCATDRPETERSVTDVTGCTADSYEWMPGAWSNDEPSCGAVEQHRTAICQRADGVAVDAGNCTKTFEGERIKDDDRTCSYQWRISPWAEWSSTCSPSAQRERDVKCVRSDGTPADDVSCADTKPQGKETGAVYSGCGFQWNAGPWGSVSGCGQVPQSRNVACVRSDGTTVADASCATDPRPDDVRTAEATDACRYFNQPGDWSAWSSTCSPRATRSRSVSCVREDGAPAGDDMCAKSPILPRTEDGAVYTGCSYQWKDGGVTYPPKTCGTIQISHVFFCLRSDGTAVADTDCTTPKPVKTEEGYDGTTCTFAWTAGSWSIWSSTCSSTATRTRTVTCMSSDGREAPGKCTDQAPGASEKSEIYTGCSYAWKTAEWKSAPYCGDVTETRGLECVRSDLKTVSDSFCTEPRPETQRPGTNYDACTYAWSTGAWSDYSSTCSTNASRTRSVTCQRSDKTTVGGSLCTGVMPAPSETAGAFTGCQYKWTTYPWVSTYSCSESDVQTRRVECTRADDLSSTVADSSCSGVGAKPATSQTVRNTDSCSASLVNNGFESGLYGWNSTAPVEVSTAVVHGGAKSVRMDPNGQLRQYVKTTNGQRYTLGYWVYTKNGIYMNAYGPQGAINENKALPNSSFQWVYLTGTFTGNGGVVQLGFYHYAPSGGTSWIDDVTVTPG